MNESKQMDKHDNSGDSEIAGNRDEMESAIRDLRSWITSRSTASGWNPSSPVNRRNSSDSNGGIALNIMENGGSAKKVECRRLKSEEKVKVTNNSNNNNINNREEDFSRDSNSFISARPQTAPIVLFEPQKMTEHHVQRHEKNQKKSSSPSKLSSKTNGNEKLKPDDSSMMNKIHKEKNLNSVTTATSSSFSDPDSRNSTASAGATTNSEQPQLRWSDMNEEDIIELLRKKPSSKIELKTRKSFQQFFQGVDKKSLERMLYAAYKGSMSDAKCMMKVEKRSSLLLNEDDSFVPM